MSQIFPVTQSLHPLETFCLWTLVVAINVSVAICQFVNFVHLEKGLLSKCYQIEFFIKERGCDKSDCHNLRKIQK